MDYSLLIDNYFEKNMNKYLEYYDNDMEIINIMKYEKKRDIMQAIKNGNLKEEDISNIHDITVEKIAYESFKGIVKKKEEMKNRLDNASYTTAYKCYKCGHNQTTVCYVQTRSCDEPMTAFIKCVRCKYQFRN